MKKSINLLQESQKRKSDILKIGILLQTISIGSLIAYAFIVISIISYFMFVSAKYSRTTEKVNRTRESIENLKTKEIMYSLMKQKLILIREIIEDRGIDYEKLTNLFIFGGERDYVVFDALSINEESKEIVFVVTAININALNKFFNEIVSYVMENNFSGVKVGGISRINTGEYNFSIILEN